MNLITYPYLRSPSQDVLLVFDGVGVFGHPAARLHREFPHGEIWSVIGTDEDLDGGARPCFDGLPLKRAAWRNLRFMFGRHVKKRSAPSPFSDWPRTL